MKIMNYEVRRELQKQKNWKKCGLCLSGKVFGGNYTKRTVLKKITATSQLAHGCENFCKGELAYAHVGFLWICANKLYVIISCMTQNMLLYDDMKGCPWSWKAHEDTAIILHKDQFSSRSETPELLKLFWFNSHRAKCLKNLFCVIMGYSVQFLRWFQTKTKSFNTEIWAELNYFFIHCGSTWTHYSRLLLHKFLYQYSIAWMDVI